MNKRGKTVAVFITAIIITASVSGPTTANGWYRLDHHEATTNLINKIKDRFHLLRRVEARPVKEEPAPSPEPEAPPTETDPVEVPDTVVPTTEQTNRFCINYGHQANQNSSTGYYDLNEGGQTDTDFDLLQASGINCVRLAYAWHTDSNNQRLAEYAKSRGFFVVFGGDAGVLRSKDLKTYNARVLQSAKWAEAVKIDQFSLGNEQEYRLKGVSLGTWIANLHYLSTEVKKVYHGTVSYDFSGDYLQQYINGGKGTLDKYGINAYCCWGSFADKAAAAFGEDGFYFGEFDVDRKYVSFPTDQDWADGVTAAYNDIKGHGTLPLYFFTFRDGGYGLPDGMWAVMRQDNTLVKPVADALGITTL